jgi:hypothetical protein
MEQGDEQQLRDDLAAKAMIELLKKVSIGEGRWKDVKESIGQWSYDIADSMLKQRRETTIAEQHVVGRCTLCGHVGGSFTASPKVII